jgi:hypothetical protein
MRKLGVHSRDDAVGAVRELRASAASAVGTNDVASPRGCLTPLADRLMSLALPRAN